jgi:hypothetical protein
MYRMSKPLKLDVPESLAREVRRIADVSRRPIRDVNEVVLGRLFAGVKAEDLRHRWMEYLAGELREFSLADNLVEDLNDAEAEESEPLAVET